MQAFDQFNREKTRSIIYSEISGDVETTGAIGPVIELSGGQSLHFRDNCSEVTPCDEMQIR